MYARSLVLGIVVLTGAACGGSDNAQDTDGESGSTTTGSEPTSSATPGTPTVTSTTSETETGTTTDVQPTASDSATDGPDPDSSGFDDSTGAEGGLDENGCPDSAPASWVMCEDFDAVVDPTTDLSQWNVAADTCGVEADPDPAADGDQALRITLTPGSSFGGWVTLRFGDGPDAPVVDSPEGSYEEVWVRYRVRMGEDWPGFPLRDLGQVLSMNGENWGVAANFNPHVDGMFRIHPFAWGCVVDGELQCDGQNDWTDEGLQQLWNEAGNTPLFDAEAAGRWQCIETHVRLNTVGEADGAAQMWIDGAEEFSREGIDWRGTWNDFALNGIRFSNFAPPTKTPLSYVVDDVVVGTERVGCDGF